MAVEVAERPDDAPVTTLAVLGDSTAAGVGDSVGEGRYRGFGPLLAAALGGPGQVRLVNVGRNGARTGCVRRKQMPGVFGARPQVAVLVVGLNDTLRADFDPAAVYADLSDVVATLTATGATVLTVRYHDHARVFPLPRPLARALTERIDRLNCVIDRVVREHGAHCLDLAALTACYEPTAWSIDRLHPSQRGHRLLARGFADMLVTVGHRVPAMNSLDESDDTTPTRAEQICWLITRGVPWFCRRSRDLLPLLLRVTLQRAAGARSADNPGSAPSHRVPVATRSPRCVVVARRGRFCGW